MEMLKRMSRFNRALVVWLAIGQLLMGVLIAFPIDNDLLLSIIWDITSLLPSCQSIEHAHVFNSDIGTKHQALMWMLSIPMTVIAAIVSEEDEKHAEDIDRDAKLILQFVIFVGLFFVTMMFGFYTGSRASRFVGNAPGFALLSSLHVLGLPLAFRSISIFFKRRNETGSR